MRKQLYLFFEVGSSVTGSARNYGPRPWREVKQYTRPLQDIFRQKCTLEQLYTAKTIDRSMAAEISIG
ncbi:hypothetical protein [Fulvivirga kasyanovii]|uniref:Uncharacterized protein n=1 Tax=Fulvivirga kasyanovii TaxID=396812 RepID=A0ABW9RK14_9BACT|nr:hypothetical protein [Fulvivirga kasyanovii]MTI23719.1 hypothetical protein [Fulvivirga kasyanovii]